jgi:hypothetical protein
VNYLYEPSMAMNAELHSTTPGDHVGLREMDFHRMISLERRRTGRSQRSFLLMLLDAQPFSAAAEAKACLKKILFVMPCIVRETDVFGWYKENSVIGVMFTEITFDDKSSIPATMMNRVHEMLKRNLSTKQLVQIGIEFQLLPEAKNDAAVVRESFSPVFAKISIPTIAESL